MTTYEVRCEVVFKVEAKNYDSAFDKAEQYLDSDDSFLYHDIVNIDECVKLGGKDASS